MTAVYVPWTEPASGLWVWMALVMVPMVMALIRYEHKPKLRRVLAGALVALALAVALSADDLVVQPTCEACKLVEPGSASAWLCWLIGC